MTAIPSTEKFWGTDSYLAFAFPLNPDGSLQAPDEAVYEGLEIDGTRNFNLAPAAGSTVVNIGNGRLRGTIYRAPREASTAELTVGFAQPGLKASLSGVKTYTVGEMLGIARLTDMQGSEPNLAFMVIQRGKNDDGNTRFQTTFIPKARIIPRDSVMNDNALEETYQITMDNTKKQIWGTSFSLVTHGNKEANYEQYISENPVKIVAWLADGIEDTFALPTDRLGSSAAKTAFYNFATGVLFVAGTTKTVDGDGKVTDIVFDYPPASGTLIVCIYEYDEN